MDHKMTHPVGKHISPETLKRQREEARRAQIENWFTYHPPAEKHKAAYALIRLAGLRLATTIAEVAPPGQDQDAAILKVREAVMMANAAIACAK